MSKRETMSKKRAPRKARTSKRETTGRHRRVPLGVAELKLSVPQAQDDPDHVYRFVSDKPGRLQRAVAGGYEFVEDPTLHVGDGSKSGNSEQDSRVSRIVGKDEKGNPQYGYLMRIKREWYDEDQDEKQKAIDEVDKTIKGGRFKEEAGDLRYIPEEGISIK